MRTLIAILMLMSTQVSARMEKFSTDSPPLQIRVVDPVLEPLVKRFEEEFKVRVFFPVRFYSALDNAVGSCTSWVNGARLVRIDSKRFETLNDTQKEQVMYHELGHCLFNLPHNDRRVTFSNVSDDWPASIMNSMAFDPIEALVYKLNRRYYITELKNAAR